MTGLKQRDHRISHPKTLTHQSLNVNHNVSFIFQGCPKHWYGIPAAFADRLEEIVRDLIYAEALKYQIESGAGDEEIRTLVQSTLMDKTTLFSPGILLAAGFQSFGVLRLGLCAWVSVLGILYWVF